MRSLLRPLLLAAVASTVVPAAAQAAAAPNRAVFGGATFQLAGGLPQPVTSLFNVGENGTDTITFLTSGYYKCPVGTRIYGTTLIADVAPDGKFTTSVDRTTTLDDGTVVTTNNSGSGTVSATKVSATIRGTITFTSAEGDQLDRCDTGDLPMTLRRKRVMAGATSQSDPLVITRRKSGAPKSFLVNWQSAKCKSPDDGTFVNESIVIKKFKLGKRGKFSAKGTQEGTGSGGRKYSIPYKLSGKLSKHKGSGKFRASESITAGGDRPALEDCNSGPLTWTVAAR
jgi:hypothetical protein